MQIAEERHRSEVISRPEVRSKPTPDRISHPIKRTTRTASHTDTSPCRRAALRIRHSASPNVILARGVTRAPLTCQLMSKLMRGVNVEGVVRWTLTLKEWLTPEQRLEYEHRSYFEERSSHTGKRYRIRPGRQMNVDQLDGRGHRVAILCFLPESHVPVSDVMLAQKLRLRRRTCHFKCGNPALTSSAPLRTVLTC